MPFFLVQTVSGRASMSPGTRCAMSSLRDYLFRCLITRWWRLALSGLLPGVGWVYGVVLPEAILKFRQGIGRLIRTKEDRGLVAILDNRVLLKKYGQRFLDALPESPLQII